MSTYTVKGFDVGSGPTTRIVLQLFAEGFAKGFRVYVQRELREFIREVFNRLGIAIEFREVSKMVGPYVYLGLDGDRPIVVEHDENVIVYNRVYDLRSLPDAIVWILLRMLGDKLEEDSKREIFDAVRTIICAEQISRVSEAVRASREAKVGGGGSESRKAGDAVGEVIKRLIKELLSEGSSE